MPEHKSERRQRWGLIIICSVELFERFAGLLVLSLLVLFLNEGQRLTEAKAARVAGYFNALCYLAGIFGGALADRAMSPRRASLAGLVLLTVAYLALCLASAGLPLLWVAAVAAVLGHGLFKPNVTALLGGLYAAGDRRRDSGFSWFYFAVNVGGMFAPLVGGALRTTHGWSAGFLAAASSSLVAVITLGVGFRSAEPSAAPSSEGTVTDGSQTDRDKSRTDADGLKTTSAALNRRGLLALVMLVLAVFGAVFNQSFSTLLLWARDQSRRQLGGYELPPDFFAALPAVCVLLFAPPLTLLWAALRRREREPSEPAKLALGMVLCALGYAVMWISAEQAHGARVSPLWLVGCKVALSIGEILVLPVGLSLAQALAPSRAKGLTLGLTFGAQALGYWLGGEAGALWALWPHDRFFAALTLACVTAALVVAVRARRVTAALSLP